MHTVGRNITWVDPWLSQSLIDGSLQKELAPHDLWDDFQPGIKGVRVCAEGMQLTELVDFAACWCNVHLTCWKSLADTAVAMLDAFTAHPGIFNKTCTQLLRLDV